MKTSKKILGWPCWIPFIPATPLTEIKCQAWRRSWDRSLWVTITALKYHSVYALGDGDTHHQTRNTHAIIIFKETNPYVLVIWQWWWQGSFVLGGEHLSVYSEMDLLVRWTNLKVADWLYCESDTGQLEVQAEVENVWIHWVCDIIPF